MIKKKNLKRLINLNFVDLTNRTYNCGKYDLPYIKCPNIVNPDYLALYSETFNYHKTDRTFVCFYQYDIKFDNIKGIFEAIYHNDVKLLGKYKERFKDVRYAIAPDYSEVGDIPRIENVYRLFKSRIVALWLWFECDVIVIPNITYASENYFDVMLDGMDDSEVVAFSVKGSIKEQSEKELLQKAIKYTIDKLKQLKKIVVYSVSVDDKKVLELFEYASNKGIEIVIPNNILKERNIINKEVRLNGQD